jgi:hypothetical protein
MTTPSQLGSGKTYSQINSGKTGNSYLTTVKESSKMSPNLLEIHRRQDEKNKRLI